MSWTAGSGNGGAGGCTIQYQKSDGTWANVASPISVNCDAPGGLAGTITLPGDGWYGGTWNSVATRLVRNSDGSVMCTLGKLTCNSMAGSPTPTPMIDEDCNNQWDNIVVPPSPPTPPPPPSPGCASSCIKSASDSGIPGQAYTCPDPSTCGTGFVFNGVNWTAFASGSMYNSPGCLGTASGSSSTALVQSGGGLSGKVPTSLPFGGVTVKIGGGSTCLNPGGNPSGPLITDPSAWNGPGQCLYSKSCPSTTPSPPPSPPPPPHPLYF